MRQSFSFIFVLISVFCALGTDFNSHFSDSTLCINISVVGEGKSRGVHIDSVACWDKWYGRRVNLNRLLYPDALTLLVTDRNTGDTLYIDSKYLNYSLTATIDNPVFSSLLIPYPKADVDVTVSSNTNGPEGWKEWQSTRLSVNDSLKSTLSAPSQHKLTPYRTIRKATDADAAINLALVAEGYTAAEMDKFLAKTEEIDSVMFSHEAFRSRADRFNVVAVMLESADSGVSRPSKGEIYDTALASHFDSYSLDRLITFSDVRLLWNCLEGVPAQFVMVLANTENYGGSGSYNEYAIASADNHWWHQILIHEFGHSFINLGDEYEDGFDISYTSETEPLEPNITTLCGGVCKWQDLIDEGKAALIEGAGYQSKGVWRGAEKCIMRSLTDLYFCPVCSRAIIRTVDFYTVDQSQ